MEKFDLPSGGWIQLIDIDKITERHRRTVRTAMIGLSPEMIDLLQTKNVKVEQVAAQVTREDANIMFEVNDAIAAAVIVDWSFDNPRPPLTASAIPDCAGEDYDTILAEAAKYAPAFFGVNFGASRDRNSPS